MKDIPIGPDTIKQLHKGHAEIEEKKKKEISGILVREDQPTKQHTFFNEIQMHLLESNAISI